MPKQVMHTACDVRSRFLGFSRRGSSSMTSMGKTLGRGGITAKKSSIRSGPRGAEERLCCCACSGVGAGMCAGVEEEERALRLR